MIRFALAPLTLFVALLIVAQLGCGEAPSPAVPGATSSASSASSASMGRMPAAIPPRTVVFLQPHDDPFWDSFVKFMNEAAHDLDMQVLREVADDGRQKMLLQARAAVAADPPPAALVFQNFKGNGAALLKIADEAGVPAFVVNAGIDPEVGAPREAFAHWLGEMVPDDEGAGATLAESLIAQARERELTSEGKVHLIAISGGPAEGASVERMKGLRRVVDGDDGVVLHQVVHAHWDRERARRQVGVLKRRYPRAAVVWCANDNMALGVLDGLRELRLTPGTDVLVGGVDWSPDALVAIREGRMAASVGGHFVEGGWALVLIHDHLAGVDFGGRGVRMRSAMGLITSENIEQYHKLLAGEDWAPLDFRTFSRVGRESTGYTFGWPAIRQRLGEAVKR